MNKIITNKNILSSKPIIKGTRIPVSLILNLLSLGYTAEKICKVYPQLEIGDVKAALEYARAVTERNYDLKLSRITTMV